MEKVKILGGIAGGAACVMVIILVAAHGARAVQRERCSEHVSSSAARVRGGNVPANHVNTAPTNGDHEIESERARLVETGFYSIYAARQMAYVAVEEADRVHPTRPGTRPVEVRNWEPPYTTNVMQLTHPEYLLFEAVDTMLQMHAHHERAFCRDLQQRSYQFTTFPSASDRARGVRCYLPRNAYAAEREILPLRVNEYYLRTFDGASEETAALMRETAGWEHYPLRCALIDGHRIPAACYQTSDSGVPRTP